MLHAAIYINEIENTFNKIDLHFDHIEKKLIGEKEI